MSNSFDRDELARWYDDVELCLICRRYGAEAFHHVFTRAGIYTDSILNATPLHNHTCHLRIHGRLMKRPQQEKFIFENAQRLSQQGYRLNQNDLDFIIEYKLTEVIKKALC